MRLMRFGQRSRIASKWSMLRTLLIMECASSASAMTMGPRLHDWCYLELADLEIEASNHTNESLWTRGLLMRRRIDDGDLAFFTTWCPAGTSIETLFKFVIEVTFDKGQVFDGQAV